MTDAWTNQSFRHMDLCGAAPELDQRAPDCWTKHLAWERRRNNACCFSNRYESPEGMIRYYPLLVSQRTRREKEKLLFAKSRYYVMSVNGYTPKGPRQ